MNRDHKPPPFEQLKEDAPKGPNIPFNETDGKSEQLDDTFQINALNHVINRDKEVFTDVLDDYLGDNAGQKEEELESDAEPADFAGQGNNH